jgi:hypothetical protein
MTIAACGLAPRNVLAISAMGICLLLQQNDDVGAGTRRPGLAAALNSKNGLR